MFYLAQNPQFFKNGRGRALTNGVYPKKYNKNKKKIDKLCNRIAPGYPEKCPTIERCIYQDSLLDDEICEAFRECLRDASIRVD